MTQRGFDYVVIGAGSAGCVVAHRLTEIPGAEVLLLEAGPPDTGDAIHDPARLLELWGSELDWRYATVPQPALNGRSIPIARGKVLGGSSSINAMVYIRGNRRDFDRWSDLGCHGWSYQEVLPYFKKSENHWRGASEYHGSGGPLDVRANPAPTEAAFAFCDAAVELGYEGPDGDHNAARQEDVAGMYEFNITAGFKRASTAAAFLNPIRQRANFTLETGALATRIFIENGRATGVEYVRNGETRAVRVLEEVVLSAGTFDTPKLLMLSGIGPEGLLRSLGLPVAAHMPGVGQNLQDHLLLPVIFRSPQPLPAPRFIAESGLFVRTRPGADAAPPDLQFHFSAGIPQLAPPQLSGPSFVFVPMLVQPASRGMVTLRSANPLDPPVIDPRYLSAEEDIAVLERGVEMSRELAATRAFDALRGAELAPGPGLDKYGLRHFIRAHCSTVWHVAGTCRMGRDAMAVLDPELRVRGVDGLRVADASIMPVITAGNTHATCVMTAERCAAMIKGETQPVARKAEI
jgi:choline dehydrogenase